MCTSDCFIMGRSNKCSRCRRAIVGHPGPHGKLCSYNKSLPKVTSVSNGSSVTTNTITNNVNSTQSQDTASTTSVSTASATSMSVVVPDTGQQATQAGSVSPSINSAVNSYIQQNSVPGGAMSNIYSVNTTQQSGSVGPSDVTSSVNIPVTSSVNIPDDLNNVHNVFQPSGSVGAGHMVPGSDNHGDVMPNSVLQSSGSVGPSYFVPSTGHLATMPNYVLQPTGVGHPSGSGVVPGRDLNAAIFQLLSLIRQPNVTSVSGPSVQAPLSVPAGDPGLQYVAGNQQGLHSIPQGPHSVPGATESRTSICAPHGIAQKTAEQAVSGVYVDLSEFLPPLAASNLINKTELEPYLDGRDNLSYRPKRTKRRINNFDNWLEAWAHYEKLVIKYVGVCCHEAFVDYRLFMTECNKKYNWYCVAMYDFKHRVSLAAASTMAGRFAFSTVDMNLFPTILDSTAIRPNAPRCPRCRGYDHVAAKDCPFPEGGVGESRSLRTRVKRARPRVSRMRSATILTETRACSDKHVSENMYAERVVALSRLAFAQSADPVLVKARTPFDFEFWEQNLRDHPDPHFVTSVLDGIQHGVKIGYQGPQMSVESDNWPSSTQHADEVSSIIRKNVELGRVAGPFSSPPFADFRCSPLGAVPKKSGGIRIINDLSWPPTKSVNEFISREQFSLSYTSVDAAVERIQFFSDPFISKQDIASAFTHIIVHPSDWHLLGFKWLGKYYFSMCLVFGCCSSPFNFNLYADALEYMAKSRGSSEHLDHYVDDSFTVGPTFDLLRLSDLIFQETATLAGWELQHEKCTMPKKVEELLGIVVDIPRSELRMSEERQIEILQELHHMSEVKVTTKKKLLSLIGKLSFVTKVVRSGRTFLRRLINLAKSVKYLHFRVKMNVQARLDIEWWKFNVSAHNGIGMFPSPWVTASTIELWSDASDLGAGATFGDQWLCIPFSGRKKWISQFPIAWRELYIVVVMLKTWCRELANNRLTLHIDNQVVVQSVNNGVCKNNDIMELIRELYSIMFQSNIECNCIYVPSAHNVLADALSRLDFPTFRKFRPSASLSMTLPAPIKFYDYHV